MNCWKAHGIGSNKCVDEELKYDFVNYLIKIGSKTNIRIQRQNIKIRY
jgi:hypothetical protein